MAHRAVLILKWLSLAALEVQSELSLEGIGYRRCSNTDFDVASECLANVQLVSMKPSMS